MDLQSFVFVLGPAIAKAIAKIWLKDQILAQEISSSIVDLIASRTKDTSEQKRAHLQLEDIGEKLVKGLSPLFEADEIGQGGRKAVALAMAETLRRAKIDSEQLARLDFDSDKLEQHLMGSHPKAARYFSEAESELYERVISESSKYMVDIASILPHFTERAFAEVLKRENYMIEELRQIRKGMHDTSRGISIPSMPELRDSCLRASNLAFNELIATRKDNAGRVRPGKYSPRLYVQRQRIEKAFDDFLRDRSTAGFFVVADSGLGKTNLFCRRYRKHKERNLVLFYSSTRSKYVRESDIKRVILEDFGFSYSKYDADHFYEIISLIGQRCSEAGMRLVLMFDAINEHSDPHQLLVEISELIGKCEGEAVKVAASCRSETWKRLTGMSIRESVSLPETKIYRDGESSSWTIDDFDEDLLEKAYVRYREVFEIDTSYDQLSEKTKSFLLGKRANPLMLRLISDTYAGSSIPNTAPDQDVFAGFYREKMGKDQEIRDLLGRLLDAMLACKSARPTRTLLESVDGELSRILNDPSRDSPFARLKDLTILYERGEFLEDPEIGFEYEAFFEFALATRLFPLGRSVSLEDYVRRIHEGNEFRSLWGAVKTALVLRKDWGLIEQLLEHEDVEIRGIAVEAIIQLGCSPDTREETEHFLAEILKRNRPLSKRLIAKALTEIEPCPVDLFIKLILDKNKVSSFVAIQYAYLLWKKNHDNGRCLIKKLDKQGIVLEVFPPRVSLRPLIAALELQAMIFFNYYEDEDAIRLVDEISRRRVDKVTGKGGKMLLKAATRVAMNMFSNTFGMDFDFWFRGFYRYASPEERDVVELLADYIDSERQIDEVEEHLLRCTRDPRFVEGVVKLALGAHARSHPEQVLSATVKMMNSTFPHSRAIGLESLAHATLLNDFFLPHLEAVVDRLMTLSGKEKGVDRLLGKIGLVICGAKPRKRQKIPVISEIIEKAIERSDEEMLDAALGSLEIVGVTYPENVLLTVEDIVKSGIQPRLKLVESLAKIRLVHQDLIDSYLKHDPMLENMVRRAEVSSPYGEWFGGTIFAFEVITEFPEFRSLLIEFIKRVSKVRNDREFADFVSYCVEKSTGTWLDREIFQKYLEWARKKREERATGAR